VGSEDLHAVKSLLLHMLKAAAWPQSRDVPHRQAKVRLFRAQAANRSAPSMRQRLDLTHSYRQALRALPETMDGQAPLPVSPSYPVTLDELLDQEGQGRGQIPRPDACRLQAG
jgi:hypothetical protein